MQKTIYQKIIKVLGEDRVKIDEPMVKHTTFKIGGPADLFYEAKTEDEIVNTVKLARKLGVNYFVLGGGSNLLVSDQGFRGLVIKINNEDLTVDSMGDEKYRIIAGAGIKLNALINSALKNSLAGLEFLAGIPGSLGGAVRGNAGAWGKGIGEMVGKVKILDTQGKIKIISQKDCGFNYRDSRLKKTGEIVLETAFILEKRPKTEIKKKIAGFLTKRANQPKEPSAGCIFVNPKPQVAGELIEQCRLKGKSISGAQISEKHANFFINTGGAKATDVVALIDLTKSEVKNKFRVELKEEIIRVGEF